MSLLLDGEEVGLGESHDNPGLGTIMLLTCFECSCSPRKHDRRPFLSGRFPFDSTKLPSIDEFYIANWTLFRCTVPLFHRPVQDDGKSISTGRYPSKRSLLISIFCNSPERMNGR